MTSPVPESLQPSHWRLDRVDAGFIALLAVALSSMHFGGPLWLSASPVAAFAAAVWCRPAEKNVLWYAATVGLPIPQNLAAARLSIADLCILPVIALASYDIVQHRMERWRPQSTMTIPLAALVATAALATVVGICQTGRLTSWALVNKDAGLMFQVFAFFAIARVIRTRQQAVRLARWFVTGTVTATIGGLLMVIAAKAGFENTVYLVGNHRFYGWMANPSIAGGLAFTAALLELGLLSAPVQPGDNRAWRWTGLWLTGVTLALTLSRSAWLSTGAGAAALLGLLLVDRARWDWHRARMCAVAGMWMLVPVVMLGNIALANLAAGTSVRSANRAAELKAQLLGQCATNPNLEICKDVVPDRTFPPPFVGPAAGATGPDVSGPLMNVRGLSDRLAIDRAAIREYRVSTRSTLLGIGLGTFYATSASQFGVPLIIHNTFVWFLVEFGPLGLLALLWIWGRTAWSLWQGATSGGELRYLAFGAAGALVAMAAFCLFNEGFYQRQLWVLLLLADRLSVLSPRGVLTPAVGALRRVTAH